jgi:hypothetical protein
MDDVRGMLRCMTLSDVEGNTDGRGRRLEDEFVIPHTDDGVILSGVCVSATAGSVSILTTYDAKEQVGIACSFALPKGLPITQSIDRQRVFILTRWIWVIA